ncbi:MAG: glycosylase, partial [Actinobacteria bacterium]|nr:glycosylase [Actinomycetota bacterium]
MTALRAHRLPVELHADPARVVAQLFVPGEQAHQTHSRVAAIVDRVLALDEAEVEQQAARLVEDFGPRHHAYPQLLARHAAIAAAHLDESVGLSLARSRVLGASFTAEYATEGAALCNPCAVAHPDQTGLGPAQLRVAVSLRAIGEGHVSSIAFCTAIIGPGPTWTFTEREHPALAGVTSLAKWSNNQLRAVLTDQTHAAAAHGDVDELSNAVLRGLPARFDAVDLEEAIAATSIELLARPGAAGGIDQLRRIVASAYKVDFPDDTTLAQRILRPFAADESDGMEDARFTRFTYDDASVEYRATYTAYDGRDIAPRLLLSNDLRHFHVHRLAGPAAGNKGMALFPRLVGGRHLALCRTDGENIGLASSSDGYTWSEPWLIHGPEQVWEMLQVGNCGPPIETDRGWLVLTHGVGPMRTYAIGAILLDLDDPGQVIGR